MLLESAVRPFAGEALPRRFRNMPMPYFAPEKFGTNGSARTIQRIGVDVKSLDGRIRRCQLAGNVEGVKIDSHLRDLVHAIVAFQLQEGNEATWGPAVDIEKSDPNLGVEIITSVGTYGLYVQRQSRLFFEGTKDINSLRGIVLPETELRKQYPKRYEALSRKSMDVVARMMFSA